MRLRTSIARGSSVLFTLAAALCPLRAGTPQDLGAVAAETPQTVSIIFKLRNQSELEHFIARSVDPCSRQFREFMCTEEFADRFAPTPSDFFQVIRDLKKLGITIDEIYDSRMVIRATGTTAQFNTLLGTTLHEYSDHGHRFHKPATKPKVPEDIQDIVLMVAGLDSQDAAHTHHKTTAQANDAAIGEPGPRITIPPAGAAATGVPGSLTVGDVANMYNINPLYQHKITGKGQTLGIATLANFTPSDAYAYWSALGLTVDPHRITEIPIDGGTGSNGADETTLDVEQSGGLAYQAKILVYEAPNTDSGFLDVFYRSISDNRVDTLSVSWGLAEPFLDDTTFVAFHQAFLEAAAQGIPVFASAGDAGAFDLNRDLPTPFWSSVNSVDHPASDPYVTAAGGTTLAFTLQRKYGVVVVPQERPWGWNYLENYYVTNYGQFYYDYNIYPVGGGGGVSSIFPIPSWQAGITGTQLTPPDFTHILFYPNYTATNPDTSGAQDNGSMPIGFPGRNVPDVSLNADPFTGYLLYFGGAFSSGSGGTSFVAPQLNGIASLLTQAAGGRVGFLNPQLYSLYEKHGYGPKSPYHAITTGDNLYWHAAPNYNPASGLGTLDVTKLAQELSGH